MTTPQLREKLKSLPKEPGCYLMKDSLGRIMYVGKAKNLKSRVSHYFVGVGQVDFKTQALAREIDDFEVILTKTEVEALLLERTLIKHHKPRFNILLRDDKEYPYLRIDLNEPWPRIEKVRRRKDDQATYLGPFGSAGQLKVLVDATYRIFPLIRCSRHEFEAAKRPCNYYHMKMCLGPCTLPVDPAVYKSMMQSAIDFLAGRNKEVVRSLKDKMERAATAENFELAALHRDQLKAFASVTERQSVVVGDVDDADIFGMAQNETRAAFHVLTVRDGKLVATDAFVTRAGLSSREDGFVEFILQYYDGRSLPAEVLLPFELPDVEDLSAALLTGHPDAAKVTLKVAHRGARGDLVEMAAKNAGYRLDDLGRQAEKHRVELTVLRDKLQLRRFPERMECIDISNTQGSAVVASDVCFVGGRPAKDLYRHYTVKELSGTADDFASVREVVRRRLARARRDLDLPDLLIIDGGKGQLGAAMEVRRQFPDLDFDLVSLAKSKVDKKKRGHAFITAAPADRSYERVFFPDQDMPLALSPGTPEFRLLTQIRDEAHRFAITHHRKVRARLANDSELLDVPGIGPKLRQALLTRFGGLTGIKQATLPELCQVKGLRESAAVALYSRFRSLEEDDSADAPDAAPMP